MTLSATLAINEETERRRAAGRPVLPLGFGEAGLPVHPALIDALGRAAGQASYGPVAGVPALLDAAAGYWTRRRLPTDPHQVVAGPGSKPLLLALQQAAGGAVAVPNPSWVSYAAQARLLGLDVVAVPTRHGEGGVPEPEALDRALTAARRAGRPVRLLVLTLPDNPTGTLASPAIIRAACEVAERHAVWVVSDEIYRDLVHDDAPPYLSPAEVLPDRTVVTTGLSKSLALGGWRIGVARFPDTAEADGLRGEVTAIASEIWSSAPRPVQEAAAWAFTEPAELVARVQRSRLLHGRVARAVADVFRESGVHLVSPQAGFYLYPDFTPVRAALRAGRGVRTGDDLARVLLDGAGIATLPASAFGEREPALRLRVATSLLYGATPEERETALGSDAPVALPWVADRIDALHRGLAWLIDPELAPDV